MEKDIRSKCTINSNRETDTFVGMKCTNGDVSVHFPLGFHISENNIELRKDIMLLFATLATYTEHKDSEVSGMGSNFDDVDFPLQSYMYIINDYFARGYYKEQDILYKTGKAGKISWSRTIKRRQPYMQDSDVFYLDFVTRKNVMKDNELVTLIHEYCVYKSFEQIGWLFADFMPKVPRIGWQEKTFRTVLRKKMADTFNDRNRSLFRNMLAMIDYQGDKEADKNYCYGTYRFEYVWEKMIDRVFGIENKAFYFPKTAWYVDGKKFDNASLEPDTVMVWQNNVYVLDAKYYKYGVTGKSWDLPGSTSVNKQISYGEYIATEAKFKKVHGDRMKVFNAFLMPYDSLKGNFSDNFEMVRIGEALSNWKDNSKMYEKIQGILVDVKSLMKTSVRQDIGKINKLVELIEKNEPR